MISRFVDRGATSYETRTKKYPRAGSLFFSLSLAFVEDISDATTA